MISGKKILLTGATGFLGSSILKKIIATNEIAIITREISNLSRISAFEDKFQNFSLDKKSIEDIVLSFRPDVIIHCATDYGRKAVPPLQVVEANLILPLKLIHAASKIGTNLFINTDTFLDKGINYYSLSKRQFSEWFHTYADSMLCVNMVLEHFYGPFDDKTKFVSFIIHELLSDKPQIDLTLGTQKRNFIFIEDVVSAFETVLDHSFNKSSGFFEFFIASDRTTTIKSLVLKLKEFCKNERTILNFGALPFRENEVMDSSTDISAIQALGWNPKIDLDMGLLRTIQLEKEAI